MFQRFQSLAIEAPDRVALIDGRSGAFVSRKGLLDRASTIAGELRRAGLTNGDLVAVQLPNSVDFVAAWLAILQEGLVLVPIDRDAPEIEVGQILSYFAVRGLVYRGERSATGISISTRIVEDRPPLPATARLIKLTSGSTGLPKGIVTSEANLIADFENIVSSM